MIAKSLAVKIDGQADRIYRCGRDEPDLPAQWRFVEMHKGDVPATFASPDLLERLIGYKPSTGIELGVKAFVDWYRGYYGV
jgi:nucleoside-diphosphate-sugar epimerase